MVYYELYFDPERMFRYGLGVIFKNEQGPEADHTLSHLRLHLRVPPVHLVLEYDAEAVPEHSLWVEVKLVVNQGHHLTALMWSVCA